MTGTALEARSTLDLTRAPSKQWNAEMLDVVARNVFRGQDITQTQMYYCLTVAESLALNPLIGEIYFIPGKSRDGKGPAFQPYIGRNGLVKKASERNAYYESETVHENDRFRMTRSGGTVKVTHSYGSQDRGEIVGAYAFLHFRNGDQPAFFYAKLEEYLPSFDQDWKMQASPWGNQRSAMIEKCAMIGAGRKRLDLGNVLADGEIARYQQMGEVGPGGAPPAGEAAEFSFAELSDDPQLVERLRLATSAAGWPAAKSEMVLTGLDRDELVRMAEKIELEAESVETTVSEAPGGAEGTDGAGAAEATGEGDEGITDAEVVPEPSPEQLERVAALRKRLERIEDDLNDPVLDEHQHADLSAEHDQVSTELAALENPDQLSLG